MRSSSQASVQRKVKKERSSVGKNGLGSHFIIDEDLFVYCHAYHLHSSLCKHTLESGEKIIIQEEESVLSFKKKLSIMLKGILNLIQSSHNLIF